jgi:hypothetical protein
MKRSRALQLLAEAVVLLLIGSSVLAQSGGGYDLTWNTVDGGYTFSTGGNYSLGSTVGQADAGVLTGGSYTLVGGFWGGTEVQRKLYLPLLLRG